MMPTTMHATMLMSGSRSSGSPRGFRLIWTPCSGLRSGNHGQSERETPARGVPTRHLARSAYHFGTTPQATRPLPPPFSGLSVSLSPPSWMTRARPQTSASLRRGAVTVWLMPLSVPLSSGRSPFVTRAFRTLAGFLVLGNTRAQDPDANVAEEAEAVPFHQPARQPTAMGPIIIEARTDSVASMRASPSGGQAPGEKGRLLFRSSLRHCSHRLNSTRPSGPTSWYSLR
jgi:hypothetical protein